MGEFGRYLSNYHVHFLLELAAVVVYLLCYNQAILCDSDLESPKCYWIFFILRTDSLLFYFRKVVRQ